MLQDRERREDNHGHVSGREEVGQLFLGNAAGELNVGELSVLNHLHEPRPLSSITDQDEEVLRIVAKTVGRSNNQIQPIRHPDGPDVDAHKSPFPSAVSPHQ